MYYVCLIKLLIFISMVCIQNELLYTLTAGTNLPFTPGTHFRKLLQLAGAPPTAYCFLFLSS